MTAEQVPGCALPSEDGRFELRALGDFDASPTTTDSVTREQRDVELTFPARTLAVSSSAQFNKTLERFSALSEYHSGAQLPLLFWPEGRVCPLSEDDDFLTAGGGQGVGYLPDPGLLMLAGSDAAQSASVTGALLFDARTGNVATVPAGSAQLREPRAHASVTPFGPGFLVAGGEDPTVTFPSGRRRLRQSAEVYVVADDAFDTARQITLQQPRSRHQAFAISPKQTLLIGGVTTLEAGEEQALAQLELVEHDTGLSRHVGQLQRARIAPKVVRLSDGDFFVAGGYDVNENLETSAEWVRLQPNGFYTSTPFEGSEFEVRFDQALLALPGGAVLAVGGCAPMDDPSEVCEPCRRGCMPSKGYDGFWIQSETEVVRFDLDIDAPEPVLIEQADATPLLVLPALDDATIARSYHFDPWTQEFVSAGVLEHPPRPDLPLASLDPGLAVWVTETEGRTLLAGRRSSTRGRFAQDLELISQVSPTNALWPLHLAPGQGGGRGKDSRSQLVPRTASDGSSFALELKGPASVWLTDARYLDFLFEITLLDGSTPELWLDAGRTKCAWPESEQTPARLWAIRQAEQLTLGNDTRAGTESCALDVDGRVELGLGIQNGTSELAHLRVYRSQP